MLSDKAVRNTISRVQKDTASLFVHTDPKSFSARSTDAGSNLSVVFGFDRELLVTPVYEKVNRLLLKRAIRGQSEAPSDVLNATRTHAVLAESRTPFPTDDKTLVVGDDESGQNAYIKEVRVARENKYFADERETYRTIILVHLLCDAKAVINTLKSKEMKFVNTNNKSLSESIMTYQRHWSAESQFDLNVGRAISMVYEDFTTQMAFARGCESGPLDLAL